MVQKIQGFVSLYRLIFCITVCFFAVFTAPIHAQSSDTNSSETLTAAPGETPDRNSDGDAGGAVPEAPAAISEAASAPDAFEQYRVLIDFIDNVSRNYVHSYSREELIQAAIQGVTSKLDPYSYYIAGKDLENFHRDMNSHFGGVGMAIESRNGKVLITAPLVGMPAYNAGLYAGDEILEIDGKSLEGRKVDDVLQFLTGEIGTSVKIRVKRQGVSKPLDFEVEREMILMETVVGFDRNADDSWNYWLDEKNGIAYLRITEFKDETANEIRRVLAALQSADGGADTDTSNPDSGAVQNGDSGKKDTASVSETPSDSPSDSHSDSPAVLRGLILDLRFNPGGDFNVAIEMGDMFIPEGVIVSAKGKNTVEQVWRATPAMLIPKEIPIVLLLNSYSASASEVFSACLQDNGRAAVVGERSYGKGIIQSVMDFEGGTSRLKLTTAGYYSPSGRNIHREEGAGEGEEWGIKPEDENLVQTSAEEDQLLMADMFRRGNLKTHTNIPVGKNPASFRDIQLAKALDVLEKSLKTGEKGSKILLQRSAAYREGGENSGNRRSYWRR